MRSVTRMRPTPATDTAIAAAIWGRAAEYQHGVSVHNAISLSYLNHADTGQVARIALTEVVNFALTLGWDTEPADQLNRTKPDPDLRCGPGLTLQSAATVVIVNAATAEREHPGQAAPGLRDRLIAVQAFEVVAAETYRADPSTDETTEYRLGEAAADLLLQLLGLAVQDFPQRTHHEKATALLDRQFHRLHHPTPYPAWLPA